ncbi:hypothetical protein ZTR_03134 [Talaromyces verruculosus]|nr:hypothetical protein ZTR_03134 [Talaromyces verruculosus]
MTRYTLLLRGTSARDPASELTVEERVVDIFHEEQLEEWFLCDINPMGQVPVLTHPTELSAPMPDSLAITMFLADRYPSLIPPTHGEQIHQLLNDLHSINYFSLSFPGRPQVASGFKAAVLKRLDRPGISQRYLTALKYKLEVLETDKIGGIQPAKVESEIERTRSLLARIEGYVEPQKGPWVFGLNVPTALDAHLVVFIARLRDVGRDVLIPTRLGEYASKAMEMPEWETLMEDRKTMISL